MWNAFTSDVLHFFEGVRHVVDDSFDDRPVDEHDALSGTTEEKKAAAHHPPNPLLERKDLLSNGDDDPLPPSHSDNGQDEDFAESEKKKRSVWQRVEAFGSRFFPPTTEGEAPHQREEAYAAAAHTARIIAGDEGMSSIFISLHRQRQKLRQYYLLEQRRRRLWAQMEHRLEEEKKKKKEKERAESGEKDENEKSVRTERNEGDTMRSPRDTKKDKEEEEDVPNGTSLPPMEHGGGEETTAEKREGEAVEGTTTAAPVAAAAPPPMSSSSSAKCAWKQQQEKEKEEEEEVEKQREADAERMWEEQAEDDVRALQSEMHTFLQCLSSAEREVLQRELFSTSVNNHPTTDTNGEPDLPPIPSTISSPPPFSSSVPPFQTSNNWLYVYGAGYTPQGYHWKQLQSYDDENGEGSTEDATQRTDTPSAHPTDDDDGEEHHPDTHRSDEHVHQRPSSSSAFALGGSSSSSTLPPDLRFFPFSPSSTSSIVASATTTTTLPPPPSASPEPLASASLSVARTSQRLCQRLLDESRLVRFQRNEYSHVCTPSVAVSSTPPPPVPTSSSASLVEEIPPVLHERDRMVTFFARYFLRLFLLRLRQREALQQRWVALKEESKAFQQTILNAFAAYVQTVPRKKKEMERTFLPIPTERKDAQEEGDGVVEAVPVGPLSVKDGHTRSIPPSGDNAQDEPALPVPPSSSSSPLSPSPSPCRPSERAVLEGEGNVNDGEWSASISLQRWKEVLQSEAWSEGRGEDSQNEENDAVYRFFSEMRKEEEQFEKWEREEEAMEEREEDGVGRYLRFFDPTNTKGMRNAHPSSSPEETEGFFSRFVRLLAFDEDDNDDEGDEKKKQQQTRTPKALLPSDTDHHNQREAANRTTSSSSSSTAAEVHHPTPVGEPFPLPTSSSSSSDNGSIRPTRSSSTTPKASDNHIDARPDDPYAQLHQVEQAVVEAASDAFSGFFQGLHRMVDNVIPTVLSAVDALEGTEGEAADKRPISSALPSPSPSSSSRLSPSSPPPSLAVLSPPISFGSEQGAEGEKEVEVKEEENKKSEIE